MFTVNLFYVSVVATCWFNICFGVHTILKEINLSVSEEITIESPGYPAENYNRSTNYTWIVTAPDVTEEIDIRIELDVQHTPGYRCDDYLEIQETENSNFKLFKQCGKVTTNRIARGNKLKITLYSNYDALTAKGFRLGLKVSKISTSATIKTTLTTTTLPLSKISMTAAEIKTTTTSTKPSLPHKAKTISRQLIVPLSKISTRSTIKSSLATTTIALSKISMIPETNTTTTTPTTKSVPHKTKNRNKTTIRKILSTKTPLTTVVITSNTIKTNLQDRTSTQQTTSKHILRKFSSSAPKTLHSSLSPLPSAAEIVETSKTTHVVITTVILMVGLGVVGVTIIIVVIISVRRCKQQRNNKTRPNKASDRRSLSRNTVCRVDQEYATFTEEVCDDNPYKDLPEGVYYTTSKRRSHVISSSNEYSTARFYSRLFRGSNNDRRPKEVNLPMF